MNPKNFTAFLLWLASLIPVYSQNEVSVGPQITSESGLVSGQAYVLQSQAVGTPYIADSGTYYALPNAGNTATTACVYLLLSNGDGTWKIKGQDSGLCWGTPVYNQAIAPANDADAGRWSLNFDNGVAYPTAPAADGSVLGLDRSSQKLWGYSTGTGVTKRVKIFELGEAPLSSTPLAELKGYLVNVSGEPASDLITGQWYVMYDRGMTGKNPHGYLYEQVSSHTLYNTSTAPTGLATTAARYLVRLIDADAGYYYVQTGFGNYFGAFRQSTAVAVTATPQESVTIGKINGASGHFYLQTPSTGIVLDANSLENGDATVVGWGTAPPASTGGNNDWAFYPVAIDEIGPEVALLQDQVSVTRAYQTCGRGNADVPLLRIDLSPSQPVGQATLHFTLNAAAAGNIASLYLHETTSTEFLANVPATPLAFASHVGQQTAITIPGITPGTHHYWLCATIKDDAALGDILTTALTTIDYTTSQDVTLDVAAVGNPGRQGVKVFAQQQFVFKPTTAGCRYYRIPAMILDQEGNIVVAIDKRYNSNSDLGNHKIDVVSMRSEDGGRTWQDLAKVATGDGSSDAAYGYGDAALARATNGDLICIMAAGRTMFGYGMTSAGITRSTDGGRSWARVRSLFARNFTDGVNGLKNRLGMTNFFTTSGKGLTTADGTILFATNARTTAGGNTNYCYILASTDNGNSWTLCPELAYASNDESKLEQCNDGSLLLSVRQSGNRGWNTGTYRRDDAGNLTFEWGEQYRTSDLWGNACNGDLIYYSRSSESEPDIMLHSYINTSGRESLQLAMSIDGGRKWHSIYNIQPNGSCYSTMQKLPDGSVAILYEDASYDVGNGYAINFVTLTRQQILDWFTSLGGVLPDGIDHVQHHNEHSTQKNGTLFDLSGRRITTPQKGLYIRNGQKILVQ